MEIARLRREHNQDLIRRMRNGESLTSFDSQASWYPPRPTITKDPKAIAKLYGKKAHPVKTDEETSDPNAQEQHVIKLVKS